MISMTGFGFAQRHWKDCEIQVEVRCYNNRFLDLKFSLPPYFLDMEKELRRLAASRFIRGRVEVILCIKGSPRINKKVVFDRHMALEWKKALEEMAELIPVQEPMRMLPNCDGLFCLISEEQDLPAWPDLEELFIMAMDEAVQERNREGVNLRIDIQNQAAAIGKAINNVEEYLPHHTENLKDTFKKRLADILEDSFMKDSERTLQEVVLRLAKTDVNEEIVRIKSHLQAFKKESAGVGPHGKKLDFLAQEIGREVTTMSTKLYSPEIGEAVILMKDCLEKIKEQLRNVQ